MRSGNRSATTWILAALLCLWALATLGCNVAAVPGRFTYVVKYEVTTDAAVTGVTIDIDYKDELGGTSNVPPALYDAANPWSLEFSTPFSYDDPVFYPTLDVTATAGLDAGETVTAKIIWKDYRVDFQEQVIEIGELYNDGSTVIDTVTLTGPELPVP